MKQNTFIIIFIATNIMFIILHIHKHTLLIKTSYQKQRLEKEERELTEERNRLTTNLYELQKPSYIKQFAHKNLNMQPLTLSNIKKISVEKNG